MKYIKLFENFDDSIYAEQIEDIWKVEPYNFSHIIISSLEESGLYPTCFLSFAMKPSHRFKNKMNELDVLTSFYLDDKIKRGPYLSNIDYLISQIDEMNLVIDVLFDNSDYTKIENFYDIVNSMMRAHGIPYRAPYPSYRWDDASITIRFEYTFGA